MTYSLPDNGFWLLGTKYKWIFQFSLILIQEGRIDSDVKIKVAGVQFAQITCKVLSRPYQTIKHPLSNIWDLLNKKSLAVLPRRKTLLDKQNRLGNIFEKLWNIFCLPWAKNVWWAMFSDAPKWWNTLLDKQISDIWPTMFDSLAK